MTEEQGGAVPADEKHLDGWAVAYVAFQGPVRVGYMGKVNADKSNGECVTLDEAIEYLSVEQPTREGVIRVAHGAPVEFTKELRSVTVRPLVFLPLDSLRGDDLGLFLQAQAEAEDLRGQLKHGDNRVKEVPPPKVLDAQGNPIR